MGFKVRLWRDIAETHFSFKKGMRHIILDGIVSNIREVKHDVDGRRQTAKITSDFLLFSCNP